MHDDVIKWKHFPHYWPFVRSPVNCPHKGQWRGALMFSLICVCINGWVNNGEAGDLRRHRSHYDVRHCNSTGPVIWGLIHKMLLPIYILSPYPQTGIVKWNIKWSNWDFLMARLVMGDPVFQLGKKFLVELSININCFLRRFRDFSLTPQKNVCYKGLSRGSANERRCHIVTSSLIGRAHTQYDPWLWKLHLRDPCYFYDGKYCTESRHMVCI